MTRFFFFIMMPNPVSASNESCISYKSPLRLKNERILRRLLKTISCLLREFKKVNSIKHCVKCSIESHCRCTRKPAGGCLLLSVGTIFILILVYILRRSLQYRPKIHEMHGKELLFFIHEPRIS